MFETIRENYVIHIVKSAFFTSWFGANSHNRDNCLIQNHVSLTRKKREIVLLPIPHIEALALPILVEQTTLEPTPI